MASFDGDDFIAIAVAHGKDEQAGMYDGVRRMAEEERPRLGWRKRLAGAGLKRAHPDSRVCKGNMRAALGKLCSPAVGPAVLLEPSSDGGQRGTC